MLIICYLVDTASKADLEEVKSSKSKAAAEPTDSKKNDPPAAAE